MGPPVTAPAKYRFGTFELDRGNAELRKRGIRVKLQEQPYRILCLLLDKPGDVITRETLCAVLWPEDTFVEFERSLNAAIAKLRQALGDSAESPRFIETLPKRGYRFIAPVEITGTGENRVTEATPQESVPAVTQGPESNARATKPNSQTAQVHPTIGKRRKLGALAITGGTCLLVALAAGLWLSLRPQSSVIPLTPLPLTAAQGFEGPPDFSPDGSQLAYSWDEGKRNTSHIFVKRIGSGKPLQLTAGPGLDFVPSWSPDGRVIAFLRVSGQLGAIYAVPSLGGAERKIADGYFEKPSWSPDGRFLAVAASTLPNASRSLYLIGAETGEKIHLMTPPDAKTVDFSPAFRPDGRALLFTRCVEPFRCELDVMELSTDYKPAARLPIATAENGEIVGSAWTPDGRTVVYAISEDTFQNHHLMRIRLGGNDRPERLTYAGERAAVPVIARSGNRLAYIQDLSDADIWQVEIGNSPRIFASSTRFEYNPEFSPDGKHVAFSSDRSGEMEIWVSDADGGNPVQLTRSEEHTGSPRWSPDGRWIAFDRHTKEGFRVFLMASDGGQVRKLTSNVGNFDDAIPSWSRDGNWIYYACDRTGRYEIWRVSASGGKETQVTHNGGNCALESLDGRSLYYTKDWGSTGLWELPLGGGHERLILESIQERAFALTTDGIYYLAPPLPDGSSPLRFHNLATGKDQQILSIKTDIFASTITVSSDRKTILFSALTRSGSNVMIVENFR